LPDDGYVHVVRADIQRRGLLFAGLETGIWVSFNDGRNWQSLQQNLPTAPVYDLVVKGADLVVATHGRAFWILDDITPLRQLTQQVAGSDHYLYHPKPAYRVHSGGAALSTGGLNIAQSAPNGAIIVPQKLSFISARKCWKCSLIGIIFAIGCRSPFRNGFCLSGKANLHPLAFTQSTLRHRMAVDGMAEIDQSSWSSANSFASPVSGIVILLEFVGEVRDDRPQRGHGHA
jgi:hypothetical protein